jgi:hypothetical protein
MTTFFFLPPSRRLGESKNILDIEVKRKPSRFCRSPFAQSVISVALKTLEGMEAYIH